MPCAGCQTCERELELLVRRNDYWEGPLPPDPEAPQLGPYVIKYSGNNRKVCILASNHVRQR